MLPQSPEVGATVNDNWKARENQEFAYVELARGGAQNRGVVVTGVPDFGKTKDCFTSVYGHRADFKDYVEDPDTGKGKGSCKGYKGPVRASFVHFDIDRENLSDALSDARELVSGLHGVARIAFSGSKGFHVEVPIECFGGLGANEATPAKVKNIALALANGITLDTSVYDRNRLWRVLNTKHHSGLYKVPISHEELMLDAEGIKTLATAPRDVHYPEHQEVPELVSVKDAAKGPKLKDEHAPTDEQVEALAGKIVEYMPPTTERYPFSLPLAGWLIPRVGLATAKAAMVKAWQDIGTNEDYLDRLNTAIDDTGEKLINKEPVTGGPTVDEYASGLLEAMETILRPKIRTRTSGPISAKDLLARVFEPVSWVVPGILPEGVTLLAGKPKLGKSLLAGSLCVDVAAGGAAFGNIPIVQGEALYLALEENPRRGQERLRRHLGDRGAPDGLYFEFEWPRVGEGCEEQLRAWLDEHEDARLVVIDTLARIRPPQGKNQGVYDRDYKALEPLLPIAAEYNVSILVVHHTNKMVDPDDPLDAISGSTGLSGGVDGTMILNRERGSADAFMYTVGRDVEDKKIALSFQDSTLSWKMEGDAAEYQMSQAAKTIYEALKNETNPLSAASIRELTGVPKSTAHYALNQLVSSSHLIHNNNKYEVNGVGLVGHLGHVGLVGQFGHEPYNGDVQGVQSGSNEVGHVDSDTYTDSSELSNESNESNRYGYCVCDKPLDRPDKYHCKTCRIQREIEAETTYCDYCDEELDDGWCEECQEWEAA